MSWIEPLGALFIMWLIYQIGTTLENNASQKRKEQEQKLYKELQEIYIKNVFLPTIQNIDILVHAYKQRIITNNNAKWQKTLEDFITKHIDENKGWKLKEHCVCYIYNGGGTNYYTKEFFLSDFVDNQPNVQFQMHVGILAKMHKDRTLENMITHIVKFVAYDMQLKDIHDKSANYENQLAHRLKDLGFTVDTTVKFSNQNSDIIATKNNIKFAIRCKLHSLCIVGNKAIKESRTACDYYKCDYAICISNSIYTTSAQTAADKYNVILLHDNQLDKLLEYAHSLNNTTDDIPF